MTAGALTRAPQDTNDSVEFDGSQGGLTTTPEWGYKWNRE